MGHIGDLFKKVDDLQKQVDVIKEQNDKFQDIIDQAGGVIDDDLGTRINDDVKKSNDTKKDAGSAPAPTKSSGGCGMKLSYKEQIIMKSITTQLRTKRIMSIKLLSYIDKLLKTDPHFVHQVNKEKTS